MRLRLSNGYSFSVQFRAVDEIEFRAGLRGAALQFFTREGRHAIAELHVATDSGVWLSAHYPKSNSPFIVRFGQADQARWGTAVRANQRGTWFEHELDGLADWAS